MNNKSGFTLIEIIVTIAIIGILATIGVVIYSGIQKNTRNTIRENKIAVVSESLEKYYENNGEYPSCNDMINDTAGEMLGIDQSFFVSPSAPEGELNSFECGEFSDEDFNFEDFMYEGDDYCMLEENYDDACLEYSLDYYLEGDEELYEETGDEKMDPGEALLRLVCPDDTNWLKVPGSETYGTNSFCVMKYEAKIDAPNNDGFPNPDSKPVSKPDGRVWPSVSQLDAIDLSKKTVNCNGCQLITDAQWLTIAQNVMGEATNWSNGNIYSGRSFMDEPENLSDWSLINTTADTNDNNGYFGLIENYDINDRRTLSLSTGGTIWDFAGSMSEWTDGSANGNQPGADDDSTNTYRHYDELSDPGSIIPDIFPSGTGIDGVTNENAFDIGIGGIITNKNQSGELGFLRGINYLNLQESTTKGILELAIMNRNLRTPTNGFRVTK